MNSIMKRAVSAAAALLLAASAGITGFAQESGGISGVIDKLHKEDKMLVEVSKAGDFSIETLGSDYFFFWERYDPDAQPHIDTRDMPEKFDLRDVDGKNYVPEVKLQEPWGACWSFASAAAAEISLASSLGYDYNHPDENIAALFDLSEKHLAWFTYAPLVDTEGKYASQAGEGIYVRRLHDGTYVDVSALTAEELSNAVYDGGGYNMYAPSLFSAGIGPALEEDFPYASNEDPHRSKRHLTVKIVTFDDEGFIPPGTSKNYYEEDLDIDKVDEVFAEKAAETGFETISLSEAISAQIKPDPERAGKTFVMKYTSDVGTDWTLEESDRFLSLFELTDGNLLPEPSQVDDKGGFVHNSYADAAIKSELLKGRGVVISYFGDQNMPGDSPETSYMNFLDKDGNPVNNMEDAAIWAQYTYDEKYDPDDPESVNSIVSLDHSVCIVGYDDTFPKEYFKDPNGTIGGDGAWIVRNSWGSDGNSDPIADVFWGNNGDGYFYLSYYDQSIVTPVSYAFETDPEEMQTPKNIDMYDFTVAETMLSTEFDDEIAFSNVFTAENNCVVRYVGIQTDTSDSDVTYRVYLLDENADNPTDGELVCASTDHFTFAGYHRTDLGRVLSLSKGDRYSVVVNVKSKKGNELVFSRSLNEKGFEVYAVCEDARFDEEDVPEEKRSYLYYDYRKGIVNKGESFVCAGGEWADWSDVIAEIKKLDADASGCSCYDFDNFSIRSYPETELVTVLNYTEDEDRVYAPGDVLNGYIYIGNNIGADITDSYEIELTVGGKPLTLGENNADAVFGALKADEEHLIPYSYTVTEEDAAAGRIVSEAKLKENGEYTDYVSLLTGTLTYEVKVKAAAADDSSFPAPAPSQPEKPTDKNPATGAAAGLGLLAAAIMTAFAAKRNH